MFLLIRVPLLQYKQFPGYMTCISEQTLCTAVYSGKVQSTLKSDRKNGSVGFHIYCLSKTSGSDLLSLQAEWFFSSNSHLCKLSLKAKSQAVFFLVHTSLLVMKILQDKCRPSLRCNWQNGFSRKHQREQNMKAMGQILSRYKSV